MQTKLIVKNFGPVIDVNLDLRNVNVFIGPQASGKSALAKLYTICKSPLSFYEEIELKENGKATEGKNIANNPTDNFKKTLDEYNILSFLNSDTVIDFDSELHHFRYEKEIINYDRKFLKKIEELEGLRIEKNQSDIVNILAEFVDKLFFFDRFLRDFFKIDPDLEGDHLKKYLSDKKISIEELGGIVSTIKEIEYNLSSNIALYIPSERNFITIIKGASLNLLNNNVPIPKHILSFGAEFEKASYDLEELDLGFLKKGLKYKIENGIDVVYHSIDQKIKLTESASGLQSVVPLLLPILSRNNKSTITHKSFVIEEPELNLFPRAQYELIKILEKNRLEPLSYTQDIGTIHTYTTHSPYILSAFNNILYAYKVRNKILDSQLSNKVTFGEAYKFAKNEITQIIPTYISPKNFSAYQLIEGKAFPILDRKTGLIENNYIDQTTDEMGDDFDALLDLMSKYES